MKNKIILPVQYVRKCPDPISGISHYFMLCKANKIPSIIPLDPNPREQNLKKYIYKEVKDSLTSTDNYFHLKSKGITILANSVSLDEKKYQAMVIFQQGDGIVDGGHTYKIINEANEAGDVPDNQYIKIEILTGVDPENSVSIAKGLNTAIQVSDVSLENLSEHFDWIKDELRGEYCENRIYYKENDNREGRIVSVLDIIALLTMFLPADQSSHPKIAYTGKGECLKRFKKDRKKYEEMRPLLKDILELHDYILINARDEYNTKHKGRAGNFSFMESRTKRYKLNYINEEIEYLMHNGALYPILAAFRYLVNKNSDGSITWKTGGFKEVKELCRLVLADMIASTQNVSVSRGRNPNAIGKDDSHWDNLYKTVWLNYLERDRN